MSSTSSPFTCFITIIARNYSVFSSLSASTLSEFKKIHLNNCWYSAGVLKQRFSQHCQIAIKSQVGSTVPHLSHSFRWPIVQNAPTRVTFASAKESPCRSTIMRILGKNVGLWARICKSRFQEFSSHKILRDLVNQTYKSPVLKVISMGICNQINLPRMLND